MSYYRNTFYLGKDDKILKRAAIGSGVYSNRRRDVDSRQ